MNVEILINTAAVVCPVAVAIAGWLMAELRGLRAENTRLWQHMNTVEKKMLEHYVRREDFRNAVDDVKAAMKDAAEDIKKDLQALEQRLEKQLELFRDGG